MMKNIIFLLTLVCVCNFSFSEVVSFNPSPLFVKLNVPVRDGVDGAVFEDKVYLIFGESHYSKPLPVSNYEDSQGYKRISDFYNFLGYLVDSYQKLNSQNDIMKFTKVVDEEKFTSILEENWAAVLNQYNSLKNFRVRVSWFDEIGDLQSLIQVESSAGSVYTVPMHFSLTDDGWRLKSGFSSNSAFLQEIYKSGYIGKYESGVILLGVSLPLPDDLNQLISKEGVFAPVEVPLSLFESHSL